MTSRHGVRAVAMLLLATAASAAELPCGALSAADISRLGYGKAQEGSPTPWRRNVSLDSNAAIYGREADCLWRTPHGSATLTIGDIDTNVAKGEVRTLARKVLASIQNGMKQQEQYTGSRWTISPLAGVGEEAFVARLTDLSFQVVAYQGPRVARLQVGATPGAPRKPTPEAAGALLARALAAGTGYSSAGAPPVRGEAPPGPDDAYVVTGSVAASGSLAGTFAWQSPNLVNPLPDKVEVVLSTPDKSAYLNLQVFRDGRVALRSGRLGTARLVGTGGRADYDALAGKGTVTLDSTVASGTERVHLRGSLAFQPRRR